MKKSIKNTAIFALLLFSPALIFCQTINLGILTNFEAFTGAGAATNSGIFTGDIGSNNGIISGFEGDDFVGNIYNADSVTAQARIDLLRLYIHLNDIFVTYPSTHAPAFGNGETITAGVYSIGGAGSVGGVLNLDGEGDPDAFFIIKYNGAMTVGVNAEVVLTNETRACNVFWIAEGAISVAAGAIIKGTLFAHLGAVGLGTNCDLEGRMFTMDGAITNGLGSVAIAPDCTSTIQISCSDGCISAPAVDVLESTKGFALFSSFGSVGNTGITGIDGDIGTDGGAISGFANSIHFGAEYNADAVTAQAALDLDIAYDTLLNMLPTKVHAPAFGLGETITAGVYLITGAGSLGGTITLDGEDDPDAIFVIKFAGAFNIGAQSKVILSNGTRRCNVFWVAGAGVASGAIAIGASSTMKGTLLAHGGACNMGAGGFFEGRMFSTAGAVNTNAGVIYNDPVCITSMPQPPATALPIELLSFTTAINNANVRLNWVTATEINNDYFTVEHSADGIYFSSIRKITGAGNSTQSLAYTAIDHSPFDGISYYRLKQTNYDGRSSYSRIIKEEFKNTKDFILGIYPNPFSNATTFHTNEHLKDASLIAYNSYGQIVKQIKNISGQTFSFQRDNLPGGGYAIRLVQEGTVIAIDKLIIVE